MGELQLNNYGYEDYLAIDKTLKENERIELIAGEIVFMAGASAQHQDMVLNIAFALKQKQKETKSPCHPRIAPYDLKLFRAGSHNVVQPDILLFCGEKELPCAVLEVLSPSTAHKDKGVKKELYESFGIREYFIVDIAQQIIDAYRLENGKYYYIKGFGAGDTLAIECMEIQMELNEIFETPAEDEAESFT
ncbi:MAG: Uma2 family endonuclease [Sulfuricurvum sp.]